jgi:uridylate kinase
MDATTMSDAGTEPLKPIYHRVILKLSGEAFGHGGKSGINLEATQEIARQLRRVQQSGVELAVVVGGGNIVRGEQFSAHGELIKWATADYMGMLATIMNGLALQETLESLGSQTRMMTALRLDNVAEFFIRRRAIRHLEKKRIVILAGGTGNPFVTTDSAAALRGRELDAQILLKATRVDGVYSDDPEKNPHSVRFERLTYQQVLRDNLRVMDMEAFASCRVGKLPILVFNYKRPGNIERAVAGQAVGTLVSD